MALPFSSRPRPLARCNLYRGMSGGGSNLDRLSLMWPYHEACRWRKCNVSTLDLGMANDVGQGLVALKVEAG